MAHYWLPDATSGTGTGNWTATGATGHWADDAEGTNLGKAAPGAGDSVLFGAAAFNGAGQVVTVDAAASCLNMDWSGATNTPTLAFGSQELHVYGSATFIAAMATTGSATGYLVMRGTGTLTTAGIPINAILDCYGASVTTLAGALNIGTRILYMVATSTLITGNNAITCGAFTISGTANVLTPGSSVISATAWSYSGSNLSVTANTATINVSGTGVGTFGAVDYNGASFNFIGTAHTLSGSPTGIATLTRTGTATNANTLTLTSGTTITCTTFAPIGNSRANQLLVQSSTLGTPATITATNWTGTTNVDLMDVTATNAVDLSATTTIGDAGGNTGITFPTAVAQNWVGTTSGSFSNAAKWTSRIPLVGIDDVTFAGITFDSAQTITWNMPRIGKSIDFSGMSWTGTATTVTRTVATTTYGSLTYKTGMTYTPTSYACYFGGRGTYTLTSAGAILSGQFWIVAPTGTLLLGDDTSFSGQSCIINAGTLDQNNKNLTVGYLNNNSSLTHSLLLRSGIITVDGLIATLKWQANASLDAGTSTIILTNGGTNAQTFAGGGLTYNNVTVAGAGAYALTITGNNTFNTLLNDSSVAVKIITGTAGSIQTVRKLLAFSSPTNVAIFNSTGAAWTITGNSGYCELNYVNLTNVVAGYKKTYYAGTNSTNGGGNTNWIFGRKVRAVRRHGRW